MWTKYLYLQIMTHIRTAISLINSGVNVNSVVDIRDKTNSEIVKQAEKLGIKIH